MRANISRDVYSQPLVDALFDGFPTALRWAQVVSAFEHALPAPVRGGAASTLFLVGVEPTSLRVASRMTSAESASVAGRAAWRRMHRLAYYLWPLRRLRPLLLVAQLDDISDLPRLRVPKFASNGGGGARCGHKLPVPILLKGLGSTDLVHRLHARAAATELREARAPWGQRSRVAAWRGSARSVVPSETCETAPLARWEDHPRGQLVAISSRHPDEIDAGYSELEKLPGGNTTAVPIRRGMSWVEMGRRKFLIEVDGHGYQASLAAKMMLRSVVLTQASRWRLWYEPWLRDMEHVVVVRPDLSDLREKLAWLWRHDATAQKIGERGAVWIGRLLQEDSILQYMRRVLLRYHRLFTSEPPPAQEALFRSLCSARRTCKFFTAEAPPKLFAKKADSAAALEALSSDAVIDSCPTSHHGDGSTRQCQSWCRALDKRDHCTWCRCATCSFCSTHAQHRPAGA